MKIELYLNNDSVPFKTVIPPEKISFNSEQLDDGSHLLILKTVGDDGRLMGVKRMSFVVQNGPTIAVHGLRDNQTVSGELDIIVNAYGSQIGDEFQIERIETPAPIPTWAWVLMLLVFAGVAGNLTSSLNSQNQYTRVPTELAAVGVHSDNAPVETASNSEEPMSLDRLGDTVYGNNCASCHQINGAGLPSVFPPLKGNPAVLDENPKDHILAVLEGVSGKVIDGVSYPTAMPGFAAVLSDEEVTAVVNHERTRWGNKAKTVSLETVRKFRKLLNKD